MLKSLLIVGTGSFIGGAMRYWLSLMVCSGYVKNIKCNLPESLSESIYVCCRVKTGSCSDLATIQLFSTRLI